jgi:AAA domain
MSDPSWKEFRENFNREQPAIEQPVPEWPEPITYGEFKTQPLEKPRPLVENLLDVSSRMIFGGGSKTYKTWAMTDMALSVNAGMPWWGFEAFQALCLYVNFELKEYYMQRRLRAIEAVKKLDLSAVESLIVWNLRGYEVPLETFKLELLKRIEKFGILVVFIDPFYKLLAGRDERISAEINLIMAAFDEVNRLTGATVIFAAHFTKGNQAGKEAIDRISGGGSINRDPDNLVTLTKHETEHAFTVDFTLRDFAPIPPFVVRWEYPLLIRTDLDPEKIKKPLGRRQECDPAELIRMVAANDDELSTGDLIAKVELELGWSSRTIARKLEILRKQKKLFKSKTTDHWNIPPNGQSLPKCFS